jgi:hypothetical protein
VAAAVAVPVGGLGEVVDAVLPRVRGRIVPGAVGVLPAGLPHAGNLPVRVRVLARIPFPEGLVLILGGLGGSVAGDQAKRVAALVTLGEG